MAIGRAPDVKLKPWLLSCSLFPVLGVMAADPAPAQDAAPPDHDLKVVILGSGTPVPHAPATQFGASVLVEAGGQPYVFDCGRGCGIRLAQVYGVRGYGRVDSLFVTHHHSDHLVGIPEVYINGRSQGRRKPFRVWGPAPHTGQMMRAFRAAFEGELEVRRLDGGNLLPATREAGQELPGLELQIKEFAEDGVVLEENGVRITAFRVIHSLHPENLAFGYRVDYNGRSVVISGDTGPSDNLVAHARGADLLIHEVLSPHSYDVIRMVVRDEERLGVMSMIHTAPAAAGEIFSRVEPGLAAYYHFDSDPADPSNVRLIDETRQTYSGPLAVGRDLMTFHVGNDVTVVSGQ